MTPVKVVPGIRKAKIGGEGTDKNPVSPEK